MESGICMYMHYESSMPVSYSIAGKLGESSMPVSYSIAGKLG